MDVFHFQLFSILCHFFSVKYFVNLSRCANFLITPFENNNKNIKSIPFYPLSAYWGEKYSKITRYFVVLYQDLIKSACAIIPTIPTSGIIQILSLPTLISLILYINLFSIRLLWLGGSSLSACLINLLL